MQLKHYKRAIIYSCFVLIMMIPATGCKKFLEPDYKTTVTTDVVFASDANAGAAINGVYATVSVNQSSNGEITRSLGMAADELGYYTTYLVYDQFRANQVLPDNSNITSLWNNYYNVIYQCNAIIENATASTGMSGSYKTQIIGEALFLRAFCHFYLVNVFGPVPLITATDKDKTIYAARSSEQEVYTQIKADLTDAMNALPADYSVSGGKRFRANKWAAAALLARAYLYTKDWANAEAMANAVLAKSSLFILQTTGNINNAFLNNNTESILEWDRTSFSGYTNEGSAFLGYLSFSTLLQFPMLPGLLNSFDSGDVRKINWIKTVNSVSTPYKYKLYDKPTSAASGENYLVLRVAEQYLIRAEARAQQNNFSGAQADINVIHTRAGLPAVTTMIDKATAMAAIEKERRTELFCEWAHRWFDLKRWPSLTSPTTKTRADDVLGALKTTWKSTAILFPLPKVARDANPNLTQNEGY